MLPVTIRKKLKSPGVDAGLNTKTSVTCSNVPEALFDAATAKKHFSKFGRVQRIRLFPKRLMCIIEYDQPLCAERAVLNAGAFDGFMFDVTRTKPRVRRKSKRDDDPDWVPDSDVEEELSAMSGAPAYRMSRQKPMDIEPETSKLKTTIRVAKPSPIKKKVTDVKHVREKPSNMSQSTSGIESPVLVATTQSSLSTFEAAAELHQLRSRTSLTPDEQWRTLDARDRVLRAWGGAGSRVHVGGATIGTCPDMCPEKELLHRQAEHQVMTLETVLGSDGQVETWRAVKQYSRSSADQEMPMCYELRPAAVLTRTCSYLLHEVADTTRQVTLADWFHFMWDRFRGIRKDITQQALCCADSIRLVEICARFHAHCAARLADLEHTQFDQKLNTDNLTKCLQTLKHMYADVTPEHKPREAEFRGYIALLNLGDANFWWEIKQLSQEIQKSEPITFAMLIFNALDNNNYVRFFRLIKAKATYLQACILLRYFNDVRARALARMVKAYAPRGGSRFPAEDVMNALAFESVENMKSFISHYGLRFSKTDDLELTVILDRNQFIEDSDPYPMARSIKLIEAKRKSTVCEVISGGQLPEADYKGHILYTSFNKDGKLKESALIAEEQGYNTINDSNKSIPALKAEIQRLFQGGKTNMNPDKFTENKGKLIAKPDTKMQSPKSVHTFVAPVNEVKEPKYSFKPAIQVAPTEIIKNSPEKLFSPDAKNVFSFSKPQESTGSNLFTKKDGNIFAAPSGKTLFQTKTVSEPKTVFGKFSNENKEPFHISNSHDSGIKSDNVFKKPDTHESVFHKPSFDSTAQSTSVFGSKNVFSKVNNDGLFKNLDNTENSGNIFVKPATAENVGKRPNIFGPFGKLDGNFSATPATSDSVFAPKDASSSKLSPSSLFKSACKPVNGSDTNSYSIFQSKNKAQSVADNILNSITTTKTDIFDFNQHDDKTQEALQQLNEEKIRHEERKLQEKLKQEEERKEYELRRQQEERRKEEERKKQEELKQLEEKRKREEQKKQDDLRKQIEAEKKAELKRKAKEENKFREAVQKESTELVDELINEVRNETVLDILKEEVEQFQNLVEYATSVTKEIVTELCNEISNSEMKAEIFWNEKTMRKWFNIWKKQYIRNCKRRCLLEDTPVWLTEKTLVEEVSHLKRLHEDATLKNMNAFHRGYKFSGELKLVPPPEPYKVMELIRSPLLKRMKQINYPYDKCFFWKVTLVSPGVNKWLHRKINVEKWLLAAFSDKGKHESKSLIHVQKQSWNHLMDFAISISLIDIDKINDVEAMDGTSGMLLYAIENEQNFTKRIEETLKHKYPYQQIPVVIIMPKDLSSQYTVEELLNSYVKNHTISAFRIFVIDPQNVSESLNCCTKSALKWMAKKFPPTPPLEIDFLKSMCQRYLGNEIWCRFKIERDSRMIMILKDLSKLIKCYNIAVDKLTDVITNEDHFNYSSFPLEFKKYLDSTSPYPKPYEFIPSCVKTSENVSAIKDIMKQLKLPNPISSFNPVDVVNMQQKIRTYCYQIGWFENPEEVVCKVITTLPNELLDLSMSCNDFSRYFEQYDLVDILNVIVYEKINRLNNFDNRYAIYQKSVLQEYSNTDWLFESQVLAEMKHKTIEFEEDIDYYIKAKRRKLAIDSMEYLMLEDKDSTIVEENIKATDENISMYKDCSEAVKQLEMQLDEGKKKSIEFENVLKAALLNV